jgi:hypothetical protein
MMRPDPGLRDAFRQRRGTGARRPPGGLEKTCAIPGPACADRWQPVTGVTFTVQAASPDAQERRPMLRNASSSLEIARETVS